MAMFYDCGPSLHPENKQVAGERLALWALARNYGCQDFVYCGPLLNEVAFSGSQAVLTFHHIGGGLKSASGDDQLQFFEIAGEDATVSPHDSSWRNGWACRGCGVLGG